MKQIQKTTIYISPVKIGLYFIMIISSLSLLISSNTRAATDTATLSTTVLPYINMTITANDTVSFGNLTPSFPEDGGVGTEITVDTSAANGYDLAVHDAVASNGSTLLHTDTTTRILDYAGTIATPTSWSGTGLGICLYDGSAKDAKWGTGTTYNDANNKYAGIPQNATAIMSKNTYSATPDVSHVSWKVDVPNDQKTGNYSGIVTFTATAHAD